MLPVRRRPGHRVVGGLTDMSEEPSVNPGYAIHEVARCVSRHTYVSEADLADIENTLFESSRTTVVLGSAEQVAKDIAEQPKEQ